MVPPKKLAVAPNGGVQGGMGCDKNKRWPSNCCPNQMHCGELKGEEDGVKLPKYYKFRAEDAPSWNNPPPDNEPQSLTQMSEEPLELKDEDNLSEYALGPQIENVESHTDPNTNEEGLTKSIGPTENDDVEKSISEKQQLIDLVDDIDVSLFHQASDKQDGVSLSDAEPMAYAQNINPFVQDTSLVDVRNIDDGPPLDGAQATGPPLDGTQATAPLSVAVFDMCRYRF